MLKSNVKLSDLRPSFDEIWLSVCSTISHRSTCPRKKVGCVLTDSDNRVLATGYNGVYSGAEHCLDNPCAGAPLSSKGNGLDLCMAIHAEQNALLRCVSVNKIHSCYVTDSPCINCLKLLLNTSCRRIVFLNDYPHKECRHLWEQAGREWVRYSGKKINV